MLPWSSSLEGSSSHKPATIPAGLTTARGRGLEDLAASRRRRALRGLDSAQDLWSGSVKHMVDSSPAASHPFEGMSDGDRRRARAKQQSGNGSVLYRRLNVGTGKRRTGFSIRGAFGQVQNRRWSDLLSFSLSLSCLYAPLLSLSRASMRLCSLCLCLYVCLYLSLSVCLSVWIYTYCVCLFFGMCFCIFHPSCLPLSPA